MPAADREPLLVVEGLRVSYASRHGRVPAVRGVDLTVGRGECLAVVGESGSGKSTVGRALIGLAGPGASVEAERAEFAGDRLLGRSERDWRALRGAGIGLVSQDALVSLDPLRRVGSEVGEAVRAHRSVPRREVGDRVRALLGDVRIPDPATSARQYPHELSGGLRQRALLASALAAEPALLIADEPTTALDVAVQGEILELLAQLRAGGTSILLISHDLSVVARTADRVAVMHAGVFVETGPTEEVLTAPRHAYTRRLLSAVPTPAAKGSRLSEEPVLTAAARPAPVGSEPLLQVIGLTKTYRRPDGGRRIAIEDAEFELAAGQVLGVLGRSGSGKSTIANLVLGLIEPDRGQVTLSGRTWSPSTDAARRAERHRVQLVPQDPLNSFDPRYTVAEIVAEGLGAHGRRGTRRVRDRVVELLGRVGIDVDLLQRRPRELSGGQRQRVAIARALAPEPDLIVCDEPVSALDMSVQAQILDLFAELRAELGTSLLFISHDLRVVYHVCDRVLVVDSGRIVEQGDVQEVFRRPQHDSTRALLAGFEHEPADAS